MLNYFYIFLETSQMFDKMLPLFFDFFSIIWNYVTVTECKYEEHSCSFLCQWCLRAATGPPVYLSPIAPCTCSLLPSEAHT